MKVNPDCCSSSSAKLPYVVVTVGVVMAVAVGRFRINKAFWSYCMVTGYYCRSNGVQKEKVED